MYQKNALAEPDFYQFLPDDTISLATVSNRIFIVNGKALPAASFDQLLASSEEFAVFVENSGGISKTEEDKTLALAPTRSVDSTTRHSLVGKEKIAEGSLPWSTYKAYFSAASGNNCCVFLWVAGLFVLVECAYAAVEFWLAQWADDRWDLGV